LRKLEIEFVKDLPEESYNQSEGGPQPVDVRMSRHHGSLAMITGRIMTGLQWMGAVEAVDNFHRRSKFRRDMVTSVRSSHDPLDGVEVPSSRLCPKHLSTLDDNLRCPAGHVCRTWMVKTRRIEFDGEQFSEKAPN
jgi:hypothetical protein